MDDTFRGEPQELRVDDLAERAGTTVRNVRAYQDRGLLPPPRRQGRVAWYSRAHLARLKLIGNLLDRGYTLVSIGELLAAWESGRDIADVIGLEEAIGAPWLTEVPRHLSVGEIVERFGLEPTDGIARSVALGLIVPEGDGFLVRSPRLLQIGAALHAAGVPMESILDVSDDLRQATEEIAALFVGLVTDHVIDSEVVERATRTELTTKAELVRRLRPMAEAATAAWLALAMERATTDQLEDHLVRWFRAHGEGTQAS